MPFDKFRAHIAEEGFCCPWAFLTAFKDTATSKLSVPAGITPRGFRFWRQQFREKKIACENCGKCLLNARRKTG